MDTSFIGSEIDLKWKAIAKWMYNFEFNSFFYYVSMWWESNMFMKTCFEIGLYFRNVN